MSTTTPDPTIEPAAPVRRRRAPRQGRLLAVWTWLVISWLLLPVAVMILFSFNDTKGRFNTTWQGFTFRWYGQLNAYPDLTGALLNSLTIALLTAVIAGALGTLIGLALGRYRFRGSGMANLVTFAAISAPEVVIGASLLSMFLSLNIPRGYLTILIAHVMFSVAFVTVTVRARVLTLDPALEEAARDLGASPVTTFRLVTLPILFPAVMAGGLLSFALSIDDYIITSFNSGNTITFPLWIWGSTRTGTPPQVNVLGTLIFVTGVLLALGNAYWARRRNR